MIIVHHLDNSRSQRVLWLLEELGLPYEVKLYKRDRRTMLAPPELKRVHPLGKAPVVEDDGIVLAETGAIVEHLVRKGAGAGGPDLGPPDDLPGALLWRQFLHYAEGSLMPPLLALLVIGRLGLLGLPAKQPLLGMFATHLRWLDDNLATRDWFAGERFTAADVMMSFPLEAARSRAGLDDRYPRLLAWLERIHARPAYEAALERGGALRSRDPITSVRPLSAFAGITAGCSGSYSPFTDICSSLDHTDRPTPLERPPALP